MAEAPPSASTCQIPRRKHRLGGFMARIEEAWAVCDRFDLQTEDLARHPPRRSGSRAPRWRCPWWRFSAVVARAEISKTAYALIQLAESADQMLGEGVLEETSVNNFSKRAFMETAQSDPEVQLMIGEAANDGQQITRKQVRQLTDEFTAATSPLLPEEIRQRTAENLLPPKSRRLL